MDDEGASMPATLDLRVGDVVWVPLAGASGAGNRWRVVEQPVSSMPAPVSAAVHVGQLPPRPRHSGLPPDSSAAAESLQVQALAPGTTELELRLGRSWEPDAPLLVHRIRVVVGP